MLNYQRLHQNLRSSTPSSSYLRWLIDLGSIDGGGARPLSYSVMWMLLEMQGLHALRGDLFELGVLHGHTLGLLASTSRQGELVLGGDIDAPVLASSVQRVKERLSASIPWIDLKAIGFSSASIQFRRALLENVGDSGIRFAHIDGEHSYELAKRDMELCEELMAPWGLICLDDVFSLACPSVTEALFAFAAQRDWELVLFAPGKAFLCRPRYFPFYRKLFMHIPGLLRDLFSTPCGMAVTSHDPDQGYISIFETGYPYYQVVGKAFDNFDDFQAWHQQP